jgi:hypothetical protein
MVYASLARVFEKWEGVRLEAGPLDQIFPIKKAS